MSPTSLLHSSDESNAILRSLAENYNILPDLIRYHVKEEIASVVDPLFTSSSNPNLSANDDSTPSSKLEALVRIYAEYLYGPSLEELFISSNGSYDQVIFSMIRSQNSALVRELWIRLNESECSFSDLALTYGQEPEKFRSGLNGPMPLGMVQPAQLVPYLKNLSIHQTSKPIHLGDWYILLRLEHYVPARFDQPMKDFLLNQQMNSFIESRVQLLLNGLPLDPLHYDEEYGLNRP